MKSTRLDLGRIFKWKEALEGNIEKREARKRQKTKRRQVVLRKNEKLTKTKIMKRREKKIRVARKG